MTLQRPDLDASWKSFDALTALELYDLIRAREAVFVVEQRCAYQEADGIDPHCWHRVVRVEGDLAACARVVPPGLRYPEPSIGRVMTVDRYRGLGLGRPLVVEAIAFTEARFPDLGIRIGAQAHLQAFYASLGFEPAGDPYDEDGIVHIEMVKPAVIDTR